METKYQSLPPVKRFTLLQQQQPQQQQQQQQQQKQQKAEDNKENNAGVPLKQLPAKKRKESRGPFVSSSSSIIAAPATTTFSLPAKKRIWALPPDLDFISGKPLSPFDLNVEYKPPVIDFNLKDKEFSGKDANFGENKENPLRVKDTNFGENKETRLEIKDTNFGENKGNPVVIKDTNFGENKENPLVISSDKSIDGKAEIEESENLIANEEGCENEEENDDDEDGILCAICKSTDGDAKDPIVFCDGCDLMVHTTCYGNPLIKSIPESEWFCSRCLHFQSKKQKELPPCCLCQSVTGALKRTNDGSWAHVVCALLVPEVFFMDPDGREGIDCSKVPKRRWEGKCYVCRVGKGCVIECSEPKCPLSFHVTCGLNEGLCIEYQERKKKEAIVAGFCKSHSELWEKQQQSGKFKIVAREEHNK